MVLPIVCLLIVGAEVIIALHHTPWHTAIGTTPLEVGPAGRRDYPRTHITYKAQTSKPPAGFEMAVPGSERPRGHRDLEFCILYLKWLLFKRRSYQFLVCPVRASARPNSYRAVNTFHLGYKNQSVYAVSGTSRCLFSDKYKTHK